MKTVEDHLGCRVFLSGDAEPMSVDRTTDFIAQAVEEAEKAGIRFLVLPFLHPDTYLDHGIAPVAYVDPRAIVAILPCVREDEPEEEAEEEAEDDDE